MVSVLWKGYRLQLHAAINLDAPPREVRRQTIRSFLVKIGTWTASNKPAWRILLFGMRGQWTRQTYSADTRLLESPGGSPGLWLLLSGSVHARSTKNNQKIARFRGLGQILSPAGILPLCTKLHTDTFIAETDVDVVFISQSNFQKMSALGGAFAAAAELLFQISLTAALQPGSEWRVNESDGQVYHCQHHQELSTGKQELSTNFDTICWV